MNTYEESNEHDEVVPHHDPKCIARAGRARTSRLVVAAEPDGGSDATSEDHRLGLHRPNLANLPEVILGHLAMSADAT